MNLKDKVVLITGAGSGMGADTARFLHHLGAQIVLLDRDSDKVKAVAAEVQGLALPCDVTDSSAIVSAVQSAVEHWGGIHIAINCAGIAPAARVVGRSGAMPLAQFEQVIQINLIGTFNVMRVCAEQMTKQSVLNEDGERGVIINTASVAAYEGQVGQAAYAASKGGVVSMTLPAARELSQFGIRVMVIAPGIIATPMMAGMPQSVQDQLAEGVPFPKRLGDPSEYAKLAQHIIENAYLNGSVIRLDAGLRLAEKA